MKVIKELRHKYGWSQRKLEEKSGVTQATISEIEQGRRTSPRYETLKSLADAFGVSVPELYEFEPVAPGSVPAAGGDETANLLALLEMHSTALVRIAKELKAEGGWAYKVAAPLVRERMREITELLDEQDQPGERNNPLADHLQETLDATGIEVPAESVQNVVAPAKTSLGKIKQTQIEDELGTPREP